MVKRLLILFFYFTLLPNFCQIQKPTIAVNARAQKDKILLRWAVNNPIEWQRSQKKDLLLTGLQ